MHTRTTAFKIEQGGKENLNIICDEESAKIMIHMLESSLTRYDGTEFYVSVVGSSVSLD